MADDKILIAHLLRRTGFGPHPGHVDALAAGGYRAAFDHIVSRPALTPDPPTLGTKDDEGSLVRWWLDTLAQPDAGLHEKMVWFWHGHLTSSLDKTEPVAMARQHGLLRKHALGNLRELLQAITVDAAMLDWLDGSSSTAEAPNENYGRELMELFALGRTINGAPTYNEADVRAAAYALSGWEVDGEKGSLVSFNPESGPTHPVNLLGQPVSSAKEVIDVICQQPACAAHIAGKLFQFFHGVPAEVEQLRTLADRFRSDGLEIRPLVLEILSDASFVEHRLNRPRLPVEWVIAADVALGRDEVDSRRDLLDTLGQMPFNPPNVAGWPVSSRWLSAGAAMTRASYAAQSAQDTEVSGTADPVGWILGQTSLFEVSDTTRAALAKVATRLDSKRDRASALFALALSSPEFALS